MSIRFRCSHCNQKYQVKDSDANRSFGCIHCHKTLTVPATSDPELTDNSFRETPPPPEAENSKMPSGLTMISKNIPESIKTSATADKPKLSINLNRPQTDSAPAQEQASPESIPSIPEPIGLKSQEPPLVNAQPVAPPPMPSLKPPSFAPPQENQQKATVKMAVQDPAYGSCPDCDALFSTPNPAICINCGKKFSPLLRAEGMGAFPAEKKVQQKEPKTKKTKSESSGENTGFIIAGVVGLVVAVLSGFLWYKIVSEMILGSSFLAPLVGVATGIGVVVCARERSQRVGILAIALTLAGIVVGKALMVHAALNFGKKSDEITTEMLVYHIYAAKQENKELDKEYPMYAKALKKKNDWKLMGKVTTYINKDIRKKIEAMSPEERKQIEDDYTIETIVNNKYSSMALKEELQKKFPELEPYLGENAFDLTPKQEKELVTVRKSVKEKMKKEIMALPIEEREEMLQSYNSLDNWISPWDRVKVVLSYIDILWIMGALSTAWKIGMGVNVRHS